MPLTSSTSSGVFEHVREVRGFHAKVGRALLNFAIGRTNQVEVWRPGDLVNLADLAKKM